MKKIIKIVALMCIISTLCSICVFAENVCTSVSGTLSTTETFDVSVGDKLFSSDKVVLKQQKGSTRQSWWGITKYYGVYGRFYISVYDKTANVYVIKEDRWNDETYTIASSKLKKKHSYTVTVKGDKDSGLFADDYSCFPFVFREWISDPIWSVSKTGENVAFCSQFPVNDNSESSNTNSNTNSTVIRGDVNGDGKVTITDLSQLQNYLASPNGNIGKGADLNGDGKISVTDLSQLRKLLAQ